MTPEMLEIVTASTGPLGTALVFLYFWLKGERQKITDKLGALELAVGSLGSAVDALRSTVDQLAGAAGVAPVSIAPAPTPPPSPYVPTLGGTPNVA